MILISTLSSSCSCSTMKFGHQTELLFPAVFRVGRVCRLWNAAASSPVLWRKVTVGHFWIASGKTQLPKTEKKIMDTFKWLAQSRSVFLVLLRGLNCIHYVWVIIYYLGKGLINKNSLSLDFLSYETFPFVTGKRMLPTQ